MSAAASQHRGIASRSQDDKLNHDMNEVQAIANTREYNASLNICLVCSLRPAFQRKPQVARYFLFAPSSRGVALGAAFQVERFPAGDGFFGCLGFFASRLLR